MALSAYSVLFIPDTPDGLLDGHHVRKMTLSVYGIESVSRLAISACLAAVSRKHQCIGPHRKDRRSDKAPDIARRLTIFLCEPVPARLRVQTGEFLSVTGKRTTN